MTKKAKISALPTQRMLGEAFGVDMRTIRNWKRKSPKGYFGPLIAAASDHPERLLLVARAKKLHEQFIETRFDDLADASTVLHGICPGHITDPEKRRLWYDTNVREFIHPAAVQAIQPKKALDLAVAKLQLAGNDVTRQALAKALGMSLRTLYRKHDAKVRELCPITRRRKPKIESGKLYNLAA